jgi:ATP-dependent DNA helicase Q1
MCRYALSGSDPIVLTLENSYFSSSEWAEDSARCGHCDNCTRDPTTVIESNVTLEAGRVLAIARLLSSRKIKVTAAQLAQAARGSGPHVKLLQLNPGDRVTLSSHVRGPMLLPQLN